jgi:hypothetical protein
MCPVVVFAFSHAQYFVSLSRELVSVCFVSQIPVTITFFSSSKRINALVHGVAQNPTWPQRLGGSKAKDTAL